MKSLSTHLGNTLLFRTFYKQPVAVSFTVKSTRFIYSVIVIEIEQLESTQVIWQMCPSYTVSTVKVVICGKYKNLNKITKI